MVDPVEVRKQAVRAEMRTLRRGLPDRAERSARIWRTVRALPAVGAAEHVVVFDTIPGEPETSPFADWCRREGKHVATPEDGVDPAWPDVVIVPGLAFTPQGDRVGQGGGWFDRFLSATRLDCTTIGVCFREQLVESVPTQPHDVAVDVVATD